MTSLCKELRSFHTKECSKEKTQGLKWKKTNQTNQKKKPNKNSMKLIRKEQAIWDGFEAITAMWTTVLRVTKRRSIQFYLTSLLWILWGAANAFLESASVWNQEALCPSGCWCCAVHKPCLNGRLPHIMSSFSEILNPCALVTVRALYQRSYSVARGVTYTHLGFQLKSPREPDLRSLDSNSSKRLDPWSLDFP